MRDEDLQSGVKEETVADEQTGSAFQSLAESGSLHRDEVFEAYKYDTFKISPKRFGEDLHWSAALLLVPIIGILWIGAAAIDGTLGTFADFQPVQDTQRLLNIGDPQPSEPDFPLVRDMLSVTVAIFAVATCAIVIRQWQLLRDAIAGAILAGALRPKLLAPSKGIEDGDADGEGGTSQSVEPLREMLDRVNVFLGRSWTGLALVVAFVMVFFFEFSETQNGIFLNLAPDGLSQADAQAWAKAAYENWWASRNNLVGYIVYHLTLLLAAYVIVLQNVIGLLAVYGIRQLDRVAILDADWLDSDGKYGWRSFARAFRTVQLSLALHGFGLAILLLIVGTDNFVWLTLLILMWLSFIGCYLLVPWLSLRKSPKAAVEQRLRLVHRQVSDCSDDLITFEAGRSAIRELRKTHFTPLGVPRPAFYPIFVTIVLPVLLAAGTIVLAPA